MKGIGISYWEYWQKEKRSNIRSLTERIDQSIIAKNCRTEVDKSRENSRQKEN